LLLCDQKHREGESLGSGAEVVAVPACDGWFAPADILKALCARGLHAVFVEGGGKTVSAFLRQGALDRLQVTVAPLLIGGGRPGVTLAPIRELADAVRGHSRRFEMGTDVLFDLDLRHAREG
jgi:riboflavin biosynthesis pyrimidine reductase